MKRAAAAIQRKLTKKYCIWVIKLDARQFAEQVGERPVSTNGRRTDLTDEEVIRLARDAKNAAKFETLWSGDAKGYTSHSEADQALICLRDMLESCGSEIS